MRRAGFSAIVSPARRSSDGGAPLADILAPSVGSRGFPIGITIYIFEASPFGLGGGPLALG
ncbi:hypothetical protein Ms3S1_31960 [Methylosinus sp. 3S-1]|uniref:Uncharacterized protein n=1 Tax=Methylosinus trichosporium (strain ATCC 35070 / NCIMB 11131 / UNIQEM 75 / OB3b) TaxID=595536 RepID=A0A2D2D2R2_METT3|nr:hypothetical protein CQW49_16230 [Methylosinus trichosporium OB3b]OBS53261.1 hypothetical protein A8B73_06660 [Methylosinus sp. 3S-1]